MSDEGPGEDPEKVVFHYSREKRLERAPEAVKKAYEQGYTPNRGFIRGLTANAGYRSILVIIVILCIAIVSVTFFGNPAGSLTVDGVPASLKAFRYGEDIYITLLFSPTDRAGKTPAAVSVSFAGNDANGMTVANREIKGVYTGKELDVRTTMPDHEIGSVAATIVFGSETAEVRVQVDRK